MSVALKSTYGLLNKAISKIHGTTLEVVKYYDKKKDLILTHPIDSFVRKRSAFMHEKELRLIYQELPLDCVGEDEKGKPLLAIQEPNDNTPKGKLIKFDLNNTITGIYVSPESGDWSFDLVVDINKKFNIEVQVVQSELYRHPYL